MKSGNRSNALLVELLIVVACFMWASTVPLRFFSTARSQSALSGQLTQALNAAQNLADRLYAAPDAVLTGPETRSSSPVRILRNTLGEAVDIRGLFPVGEGAGYAGGIVSAAADGITAALKAIEKQRLL